MPWSQWAFRETVAPEKNFTRFLRFLLLLFNEFSESFEVGRASIAHELERDAFAGLDTNAFRSHPLESKWDLKSVAGRNTIRNDVDRV
jgi:hypothetical protein